MKNSLLSEDIALAAVISSKGYTPSTVESAWVDMRNFKKVSAMLSVNGMTDTSTVDMKLEQATDSSGTGAEDVTGKAITQMVAGTDDNKEKIIDCADTDLDVANDFNHVRVSVTIANANAPLGVFLLGGFASYGPASDYNASSVSEIVN